MKTFITFLLCLGIVFHAFSQRNADGMLIQSTTQSVKERPQVLPSPPASPRSLCNEDCEWLDIRSLDEINVDGAADSYPWLSADGLRLYYLRTDGVDQFYMASRPNINTVFINPQPLNITYPTSGDPISCWLTSDEKEIYFVQTYGVGVFYAQRNSLTDPFSTPVQVQMNGLPSGFFSAPSLTQDKSQLFIYSSDQIYVFDQTGNLSYDFSEILPLNPVVPGQLSKDDNAYYLGVGPTSDCKLHVMCRDSVSNFSNSNPLNGISMQGYNGQATVDAGEQTIIFVYSPTNSWSANQLYIATAHCDPPPPVSVQDPNEIDFNIYPNPAKNVIQIETDVPLKHLSLYDLNGRLLIDQPLNHQKINRININQLESGMYFCRIITLSGKSAIRKIIVE